MFPQVQNHSIQWYSTCFCQCFISSLCSAPVWLDGTRKFICILRWLHLCFWHSFVISWDPLQKDRQCGCKLTLTSWNNCYYQMKSAGTRIVGCSFLSRSMRSRSFCHLLLHIEQCAESWPFRFETISLGPKQYSGQVQALWLPRTLSEGTLPASQLIIGLSQLDGLPPQHPLSIVEFVEHLGPLSPWAASSTRTPYGHNILDMDCPCARKKTLVCFAQFRRVLFQTRSHSVPRDRQFFRPSSWYPQGARSCQSSLIFIFVLL